MLGFILSGLLGWVLGYLRLPLIEHNDHYNFWIGFATCLAALSLLWVIFDLWEKNIRLFPFFHQDETPSPAKRSFMQMGLMIAVVVVGGSLTSAGLIFWQRASYQSQVQIQNEKMAQQAELNERTRRLQATVLINELTEKLEAELERDPQRALSQRTIDKIASLSYTFEPHLLWKEGKHSEMKLSKERGLLLLLLTKMDIDSTSFAQLKSQTSFVGADLRRASLQNTDLSGADLSYAYLVDADLSGATLDGAQMLSSNLHRANMTNVKGNGIMAQNATLTWADGSGANFVEANFNGANLTAGKFRNTNFDRVNFHSARLNEAILNGAQLTNTELKLANCAKANLSEVNFSGANVTLTNLSEAIMEETILTDATVARIGVDTPDWFEKLKAWNVQGSAVIESTQVIQEDYAKEYNYRLAKKE
ncbi:MAG: pentapeptide repeat-containing protein [Bacteroidota bacterium]